MNGHGANLLTLNPTRGRDTICENEHVTLVRNANDNVLDIARGIINSQLVIHKFGSNPNITTTEEDIWNGGNGYTGWITTASAVRCVSTGNDSGSGSSARSVKITGLDENFDILEETISLAQPAGTSALTTGTFIRVFRATVIDVGTYGVSNENVITIQTTSSVTLAVISAGLGQTEMAMYTIPRNYIGYLKRVSVNVNSQKAGRVYLWRRDNADDVSAPFQSKRIISVFSGVSRVSTTVFQSYIKIGEKSDLWASGIMEASNGGIDVNYDLVLVKINIP